MVCKDEVCQWFKNNEPHHRLELLCGLLNMCLPLELKFISTCVEDLGKRDFHDLRETECKANSSDEISQLSTVLDDRTRSKLIVWIALLSPMNHTCSSLLYKILVEAQQTNNGTATETVNHVKELLLIYTMVLHHPAFTFEQKRYIGELHRATKTLERQLDPHPKDEAQEELVQVLSPSYSSVTDQEACDSGLSVGTETEGDTTTESSGLLPTPVQLHRHFHEPHKHDLVSDVSGHVTSPLVGENGASQDACSGGSGESGEMYNDGGAVPTTYIYNSSIFDQQGLVALSNDLLTVAPGYQCNHPSNFHYYQYPPVIGTPSGTVSGGRGPISEGSSSEDNGGGSSHNRPPITTSPFSSPQSSPYVSPLQSLSPSRASSPWSRLNTTTTTTTTTTAASLPLVTSSTTSSVSSLSSTPSSPQLVHKTPTVGTQLNEGAQSNSPVLTQSSVVTSHVHRGKPPASGSRSQRQGDRSGSRTRVSGTQILETGTVPANQNQNLHSPSAARSISVSCGHSRNSSSRWPANSSPVALSTSSSTTSSSKNITRQNSLSPSLNCGTNTCRTSAATTSSSGCKSHSVSSHEGSGITSTLSSSSAITNTRNTVSQGGGSIDKNVHTVSNHSGARSSAPIESSSSAHKTSVDNAVVNNNILNFELRKQEKFPKCIRMLPGISYEELRRASDRELMEMGMGKAAVAKLRRYIPSMETSANHRPNGFSNPPPNPLPQSSLHSQHIPYSMSYGSSPQTNTNTSVCNSSSPSPQTALDHPSPSGTPNHIKPKTPCVVDDIQNSSAISPKNSQVPPQNTVQVFPLDASGNCSKTSPALHVTSSQQTISHNTALPYSQSSNMSSTPASSITTAVSDDVSSLAVSVTCTVPPSPLSANVITITTTTVSLSSTTTTTANITTTTNVTQCHSYTVLPSQKISMSVGTPTPNTSSPSTSVVSNQGSHGSSNSTHSSFSTNQPPSAVPTCVSPSNGVPHYMNTPPPPIHHKTPPLPPGQHRTPPPPLGAPPRTPSREPSTSSTSPGFIPSSGTQHMYYTSSSGSSCKANSSVSSSICITTPATIPMNGTVYGGSSGNILSTTTSSGTHTLISNVSLPVYTSSGSIPVPPPNSGGLLPMVPPGGQYHPQTYFYPFVSGGAGPGSHPYVPPAAYAAQHRPLFLSALGQFPHIKPAPPQSGAPIISGSSSRGGSSSSSSCSSSSSSSSGSNRGFKKGIQRNGPTKIASHSSDSSPSSSQYSSPPQTPSPDHTRESNLEKRGKGHGDVADNNGDGGDSLTHMGSGASEDGTPPPLQPQPIHIMQAPTPLPRHRYMPYQHLAVWNPQAGMPRYPSLSLPTQGPGVAPRNPVPHTSDKSSRETTPPAPVTLPVVQQDPQCCIRSPTDGSTVPTTCNGSSVHGRNGGSPLTAPSHHEGPLPHPAHNPVPSVASAPAGQIPPGNTCAGGPHTSVQYNAAGYPMFMGAQMFQHFPGFVQPHNSALSNGFVPPSLPQTNFVFPTVGNGMNAEFMYGQYPLLSGTSQSGGGPAPACGAPNAIGPSSTPGSGLTASLTYPHFPPTLLHTHNPSAGAKKTCYNCGQPGHRGAECKEASIEEMCKRTKDRLV